MAPINPFCPNHRPATTALAGRRAAGPGRQGQMDWDEPQAKTVVGPAIGENLETLSVAELKNRVSDLKAEIERVEAEIARKEKVGAAADAVFKS